MSKTGIDIQDINSIVESYYHEKAWIQRFKLQLKQWSRGFSRILSF